MATLTVSAADEKRVKALGFLSNKGTDNFSGRVITVNGKLNAEQWACIAEAAEKFGNGQITLTTRLTVEVQGIPYEKIDDFMAYIAKAGLVTGGTGSKVRPIVSCKGTTCQYGLLDSFALSEEIHNRFYVGYHNVKLPHKFKIAVGGCPNNCVKPDLNDLGIIGQRVPNFDEDSCNGCKKCQIAATCPIGAAKMGDEILEIDPEICNHCGRCIGKCPFHAIEDGEYGYAIYLGGRWGKKVAAGKKMPVVFHSQEEAMAVIEKAILLFREQGKTGERFQQTIERIGFENVCEQLLANDLLDRKQAILDAKLHEVGGATC
jgi:dissimilatory sulfite reductase (desulfoviridin) alpha/beta subunit